MWSIKNKTGGIKKEICTILNLWFFPLINYNECFFFLLQLITCFFTIFGILIDWKEKEEFFFIFNFGTAHFNNQKIYEHFSAYRYQLLSVLKLMRSKRVKSMENKKLLSYKNLFSFFKKFSFFFVMNEISKGKIILRWGGCGCRDGFIWEEDGMFWDVFNKYRTGRCQDERDVKNFQLERKI